MWKLPNGKVTRAPKGVLIEDVNYPASIFRRWSKDELNAIGIYPFREVSYDNQFYRSTGITDTEAAGEILREHTLVRRFTNQELKAMFIKLMKTRVRSLWKHAKEEHEYLLMFDEENTTDIETWVMYMSDLRLAVENIKTALADISSYEDGIEFVRTGSWAILPEIPFQDNVI